jgi:hypothetical protein
MLLCEQLGLTDVNHPHVRGFDQGLQFGWTQKWLGGKGTTDKQTCDNDMEEYFHGSQYPRKPLS